ncbi:hypothetical protein GCM10008957_54540 [Deinococcus ruber]|uniref:Uncharacterized protein n=2 Tax=Deinococcus ruber TaxID=1848197 RepID=A0A918KX64_9DEIO|nr:hypothetical protein GCM10008957_54540 [Deinococcus ruber]
MKELTIHAGETIRVTANIATDYVDRPVEGTGLRTSFENAPLNAFDLTALPNAYTYDTFIVVSGLIDSSKPLGGDTYTWVKVHVVGSAPAPWLHSEALAGTAGTVETEFVRLLNEARSKGGTCTDSSTGQTKSFPPAPVVTLNQIASSGLRVKAKDAVTRSWYTHSSPEGLGYNDYIQQAGTTGFINEALLTEAPDTTLTPTQEATFDLALFMHSYIHCGIMYGSAKTAGGQVAVGWYSGLDTHLGYTMAVMPVSFTDSNAIQGQPVLELK